jgi:hypothetical protein
VPGSCEQGNEASQEGLCSWSTLVRATSLLMPVAGLCGWKTAMNMSEHVSLL